MDPKALSAILGIAPDTDFANLNKVVINRISSTLPEDATIVGSVKAGNESMGNSATVIEDGIHPRRHVLVGNRLASGQFVAPTQNSDIGYTVNLATAADRYEQNMASGYRSACMAADVNAFNTHGEDALSKGILVVENTTGAANGQSKVLVPVNGKGTYAHTFHGSRNNDEVTLFDDAYTDHACTKVDMKNPEDESGLPTPHVVVDPEHWKEHCETVKASLQPTGALHKWDGLSFHLLATDPDASGVAKVHATFHREPPGSSLGSQFEPAMPTNDLKEHFGIEAGAVTLDAENPAAAAAAAVFGEGAGAMVVRSAAAASK